MAKRLWDKGEPIDARMQRLTVGNDPQVDLTLVTFDCIGSAAHARMLAKIGLLSHAELRALLTGLKKLYEESVAGKFEISQDLEDCHTAIEARLTQVAGEAGKRIHTGRSRNDQVILAMRLYLRNRTLFLLGRLVDVAGLFFERFESDGHLPMPGTTHMQRAMPSSVGLWLHAFAEGCIDSIRSGMHLLDELDSNPLGSAAGFGVPFPLDRQYVAELLGFSRVDRSVVDVQNRRGRDEGRFLSWCSEIAGLLEKFGWDIVLFSTDEFGFVSLPGQLTTGSSIMPQKRNPDLAEMLRGRAARVRGAASELQWAAAKLPSNYHRDLQYTKDPTMRGAAETADMLEMTELLVQGLEFNAARLQAAMGEELYATYDAFRRVQTGTPFREAYRQTADALAKGELRVGDLSSDFSMIAEATKLSVAEAVAELDKWRSLWEGHRLVIETVEEIVFEDL